MSEIPFGAYTYSDSYLRKLKKNELIEYYRTLEKNWFGLIEAKKYSVWKFKENT